MEKDKSFIMCMILEVSDFDLHPNSCALDAQEEYVCLEDVSTDSLFHTETLFILLSDIQCPSCL